jgi:3-(3-hydroxy-phenyl)propionate hydroxylase
MREAALSLSLAHPRVASLLNPRQTSAVAYAVLLHLGDDFADGVQRGHAPVDVPVTWPDGTAGHLLDRVRSRFTLLVLGEGVWSADKVAQNPGHAADPIDVLQFTGDASAQPALASAWGWRRAYLLRPDGHIAAIYRLAQSNIAQAAIKNIVQ